MDITTVFWIGIVLGIVLMVCAVCINSEDVSPVLVIGGFLLLLGCGIGNFYNYVGRHETAIEVCKENAPYKKGTQVKIKGVATPMTVLDIWCRNSSTQLREYELGTAEGIVLEAMEAELESNGNLR